MSILVIAAHPDDEVLGCGGTIARLTAEGERVVIGIIGEGITSRYDQREAADAAQLSALHERSRLAARLLGVEDVMMANLPDNRLDTVALLEVVKTIERWLAEVHPATVYVQHGGDLNIDHAVTFRATLTATRPVGDSTVRDIFAYEVASSTEWAFQQFAPPFRPNTFVDVTATLERKIAAMECYESEARRFPHPRSREALRAAAVRWGAVAGVAAAEAFQLIRSVR